MSELAFPDEMEVLNVDPMSTFANGLYTDILKHKTKRRVTARISELAFLMSIS